MIQYNNFIYTQYYDNYDNQLTAYLPNYNNCKKKKIEIAFHEGHVEEIYLKLGRLSLVLNMVKMKLLMLVDPQLSSIVQNFSSDNQCVVVEEQNLFSVFLN